MNFSRSAVVSEDLFADEIRAQECPRYTYLSLPSFSIGQYPKTALP